MLKKTEEFVTEVNELKEIYLGLFMDGDMLMNMNPEILDLFQRTFRIMNIYCEMMLADAKLMHSIDRKLDRLLEQKD